MTSKGARPGRNRGTDPEDARKAIAEQRRLDAMAKEQQQMTERLLALAHGESEAADRRQGGRK